MEKIRSMLKSPQGGSFNLIGDTYIKTPTHDEVMKCLDAVDDCRYHDLITKSFTQNEYVLYVEWAS